MKSRIAAGAFVAALSSIAYAAQPPIEAYGERPDIIDMAISPDGKHFAYIGNKNGEEFFAVATVGGGVIGGGKGEFKARSVAFADSNHAIFRASNKESLFGYDQDFEFSGALSFNLTTKKSVMLLGREADLYPGQSGLGRIEGVYAETGEVFMPAFFGGGEKYPTYDLARVDLDTGRARSHQKGAPHTRRWIVDRAGVVRAREDFVEQDNTYRILSEKNGKIEEIYRVEGDELPSLTVVGINAAGDALIVSSRAEGEQFDRFRKLGFDGQLSTPLYAEVKADVENVYTDLNNTVFGTRFSGMAPTYAMDDPALDADMKALASMFAGSAVYLRDWTEDKTSLLLLVEGGVRTPGYYLYRRAEKTVVNLANSYARISDSEIGLATTIEYKARDGRKIPAVITLPPGKALGEKLPLIVMPHGGPEAYSAVGFDFMAQYFANRGYLVLQPNFRGSAGFGVEHLEAGYGEWGGKMQDDVTDGAELLIRKGWADGERTCIIGGSYGGYAALAGGAFTPSLYKCVAAIAPVSDLAAMLADKRRDRGDKSSVYAYWTMLIGDRGKDKAKIDAVSPANSAKTFTAPVLLLHGTDDTVVPFNQSLKMEGALKSAGMSVRLVKLKGEDHWLSQSATRLQALKELDAFVAENIGR